MFRSQRIAVEAYQLVSARSQGNGAQKYLSYARSFPTLVHTSGLSQAVAFSRAKGKEHLHLVEDVASLIVAISPELLFANNGKDNDNVERFCRSAREADRNHYIRLSRLTLDASGWIKRYAEALIEPEEKISDNGSPEEASAATQEG